MRDDLLIGENKLQDQRPTGPCLKPWQTLLGQLWSNDGRPCSHISNKILYLHLWMPPSYSVRGRNYPFEGDKEKKKGGKTEESPYLVEIKWPKLCCVIPGGCDLLELASSWLLVTNGTHSLGGMEGGKEQAHGLMSSTGRLHYDQERLSHLIGVHVVCVQVPRYILPLHPMKVEGKDEEGDVNYCSCLSECKKWVSLLNFVWVR